MKQGIDPEPYLRLVPWLVMKIMGSYAIDRAKREDLEGWGYLGLCEAAKRYKPIPRVPFEAYARKIIKAYVIDNLCKWQAQKKAPRGALNKLRKAARELERPIFSEEVREYAGVGERSQIAAERWFKLQSTLPMQLENDEGGMVALQVEDPNAGIDYVSVDFDKEQLYSKAGLTKKEIKLFESVVIDEISYNRLSKRYRVSRECVRLRFGRVMPKVQRAAKELDICY